MSNLRKVSRRAFLRRSTAAALGATLPSIPLFADRPTDEPFTARALRLAPVYDVPGGVCIGHLAPDSVHQVRAAEGWFTIDAGCIAQTDMQPIAPYAAPIVESSAALPFWAEVIAPSSVLRGWCSGRAPAQATFGFGALVRVIGLLVDDAGVTWYESAERGWLIGQHLARVDMTPIQYADALHLQITFSRRMLRLYAGPTLVLRSPFYGGGEALSDIQTASLQVTTPGASGIPWRMRLSSGTHERDVYGAYWHNRFGLPGGDADLHLPIQAAKALYRALIESACPVQFEV